MITKKMPEKQAPSDVSQGEATTTEMNSGDALNVVLNKLVTHFTQPGTSEGMPKDEVLVYNGKTPDVDDDYESVNVKFMSYRKLFRMYVSDSLAIQFQGRVFLTGDPEIIKYLRSSKLLNQEFWENELPEHIVTKIEKYNSTVSFDPEEYPDKTAQI